MEYKAYVGVSKLRQLFLRKGVDIGVVDNDGRLVGIFTDGDIRRRLSEGVNLMEKTISEVMGKSPKTISSDSLAAAALLKINESK